ncbi:MAG: respiratory nitrate reductase subunit gamma, partial [Deltaproteobacteria bacterium]|nr:respiratory nitrate reductase subunit gamma [Deltaproteobacteria bacterium]
MQTLYYIILVPMVYLAFLVFIVGTVVQIGRILHRPKFIPTLKIYPEKHPVWLWTLLDTFLLPTVRRHNIVLWFFLMTLHICILLLIIGHLELMSDFRILQVWEHEIFLGRGLVGLLMTVALIFLMFRRFVSPVKDLSVPEDYFLLILLMLTVIFGSEMDWARRWYDYSEMGVSEYRAYFQGLLVLKPAIGGVTKAGHSFMMAAHVFFA